MIQVRVKRQLAPPEMDPQGVFDYVEVVYELLARPVLLHQHSHLALVPQREVVDHGSVEAFHRSEHFLSRLRITNRNTAIFLSKDFEVPNINSLFMTLFDNLFGDRMEGSVDWIVGVIAPTLHTRLVIPSSEGHHSHAQL